MTLSIEGMTLIKQFEGCKLTAYKPVSTERYWTIGYGHYGPDVKKGQHITETEAERMFRNDIKPVEALLNQMGINFRQQQFDALVSWIYNLGAANFNNSTMKKFIKANAADIDITDQMVKWVRSGGKPLLGLKRRRVAEANHWLSRQAYSIDKDGNIIRL